MAYIMQLVWPWPPEILSRAKLPGRLLFEVKRYGSDIINILMLELRESYLI